MKIRKLYIILWVFCIFAQYVSAQQNMFVVRDDGSVNIIDVKSVNYATFKANGKWFTITNDNIQVVTTTFITADCTVKLSADADVKSLSVTPEVGICYSKDNTVPTIDDDTLLLGSELKSYTFTLKSLVHGTKYYYRVYIKLANAFIYGDIATTKTLGTTPQDKIINGHKFVDLDLPSGLLWAETNIGAEKSADEGNYYAWGETEPKSCYDFSTYKYGSSSKEMTKYNSIDGKTTLDKEDDAAYVNWGDSCHIPTKDDFKELRNSDNCIWTLIRLTTSSGYSMRGYKVTSKKNGNSIFLPASGNRSGKGGEGGHGSDGHYWTSMQYGSHIQGYVTTFDFYIEQGIMYLYYSVPCVGNTVRPVAERK